MIVNTLILKACTCFNSSKKDIKSCKWYNLKWPKKLLITSIFEIVSDNKRFYVIRCNENNHIHQEHQLIYLWVFCFSGIVNVHDLTAWVWSALADFISTNLLLMLLIRWMMDNGWPQFVDQSRDWLLFGSCQRSCCFSTSCLRCSSLLRCFIRALKTFTASRRHEI